MPDVVVAVQVQVHNVAVVTPQHTGSIRGYHRCGFTAYRCGLDATLMWVKALKRQQQIKIHQKRQIIILRKAKLFKVQNSFFKKQKCC